MLEPGKEDALTPVSVTTVLVTMFFGLYVTR